MKLERKLAAWRQADLITAEQARAILEFEERRSGTGSWIVLALGAVGALAVVTGLISLIAANWDTIPAVVKLACSFALLIGSLAVAHVLSADGKTLASDLFLVAHAGLVLAMIGLVGQVYHLSGAAWRPLALAAFLAVPAAVISRRSVLTDILVAYALAALGLFLEQSRGMRPELAGFGWPLAGAFIGAVLLWVADVLRRLHPAATRALRRWAAGLLLTVTIAAAIAWSVGWSGSTRPTLIALCCSVTAAWLVRLAWARKAPLALAAGALGALIVGATWIGKSYPNGGWHSVAASSRFLGFALFCIAGAAFAVAAAQAGSRRLTNLFTLVIAGRIIVLFLEVLSTLAWTGFSLLLTGVVFCGVAWTWWRLHGVLPVNEAKP